MTWQCGLRFLILDERKNYLIIIANQFCDITWISNLIYNNKIIIKIAILKRSISKNERHENASFLIPV